MSKLVREYFPNVPEICVGCPCLEIAAEWLSLDFGVTAEAATSANNPANPNYDAEKIDHARQDIVEALGVYFTNKAIVHGQLAPVIAQSLWQKCPDGPYELSKAHLFSKGTRKRSGSNATLSLFFPHS